MSTKVTLILGNDQDDHAMHILEHLRSLQSDVELLDSRWFPESLGLSLEPSTGSWRIELPNGRRLLSHQIGSVYWRSYDGIGDIPLTDAYQKFIAEYDARSLFESFLIHLPARWVNSWAAFQLHQTKPVQLCRAVQLGLPVPATLLTNVGREVTNWTSQRDPCIFKPVQGGDHARLLMAAHLSPQNLSSLQRSPVTIQEAVPGTNVRVFVAGQRVVACEVRTGSIDYRDDPQAELIQHTLPASRVDDCIRLARDFHLLWTGIDFRLTPGGQYIFLEANPSPMFLGFEQSTRLPLTQILTDVLLDE